MPKFRKSKNKEKKYDALTPSGKWVSFGARGMQHYKDQTPLKLYQKDDHGDKQRRERYRARHSKIMDSSGRPAYKNPEQASYYAWNYLW